MRPEEIGAELAARSYRAAASAGLRSAHAPPPSALPPVPTLVVLWDQFEMTFASEQTWILTFKGLLFTAVMDPSGAVTADLPSKIAAVESLVVPIVDGFAPHVLDATTHDENRTLGGAVDFVSVVSGQLNRQIPYAGQTCFGGELIYRCKVRRATGGS